MANIKVRVGQQNSVRVLATSPLPSIRLEELANVNIPVLNDRDVLIYDLATDTFVTGEFGDFGDF